MYLEADAICLFTVQKDKISESPYTDQTTDKTGKNIDQTIQTTEDFLSALSDVNCCKLL